MITQKELKTMLHYDPDTGVFKRLARTSQNTKIGDIAGCLHHKKHSGKKYLLFRIKGKLYPCHRLAFLYMTGSFPTDQVDHENGNGIDNRWCNLREVTSQDNQRNLRKPIHNTSGVVGVVWHKQLNKWHAKIQVMRKNISLGCYIDFNDAVCARKNAEIKYGFHANHGSIRSL